MRALIAAALASACLVGTARAETERCKVSYVSVPDDVVAEIEQWVSAEPHCRGTIALRVIPTKDGLYLFAERPDGTVHERVVPDVTAAGVLVASWVADAWRVKPPRPRRAKVATKVEADEVHVEDDAPAPSPPSQAKQWLSLGVVLPSHGDDAGLRLDLDVKSGGGWALGIYAQRATALLDLMTSGGHRVGTVDDWSLGLALSRTARFGRWELRGALGIHVLTSAVGENFGVEDLPMFAAEPVVAPELAASLSRDLGSRWAVALAIVASSYTQDWRQNTEASRAWDPDFYPDEGTYTRNVSQAVWVASLRRRI